MRYPERERRFLGCIRMPLSAIYQMQVGEPLYLIATAPQDCPLDAPPLPSSPRS